MGLSTRKIAVSDVYRVNRSFTIDYFAEKNTDPSSLLYEAGAILLIAIAIVIVRFRKSRLLGIEDEKDDL